MSDLCAPLYIVMAGNEEMTFWCFVEVMNRMVSRLHVRPHPCVYIIYRNKISCEIKVE